jgi:hypothetical protein
MGDFIEVVAMALLWLAAVVGLVALWGYLRRRQQRAEVDAMVARVITDARRAAAISVARQRVRR